MSYPNLKVAVPALEASSRFCVIFRKGAHSNCGTMWEKGKKNKAQYHKAFKSHEYELNTPHISLLWV